MDWDFSDQISVITWPQTEGKAAALATQEGQGIELGTEAKGEWVAP